MTLAHVPHMRKTDRMTGPGTIESQPIYVCLHCGADIYLEPTEGTWVYGCEGHISCCDRNGGALCKLGGGW